MKRDCNKYARAIHEAGHAIVAQALGSTSAFATVSKDITEQVGFARGEWWGGPDAVYISRPNPSLTDDDRICILWAGHAAEKLFSKNPPDFTRAGDFEVICGVVGVRASKRMLLQPTIKLGKDIAATILQQHSRKVKSLARQPYANKAVVWNGKWKAATPKDIKTVLFKITRGEL